MAPRHFRWPHVWELMTGLSLMVGTYAWSQANAPIGAQAAELCLQRAEELAPPVWRALVERRRATEARLRQTLIGPPGKLGQLSRGSEVDLTMRAEASGRVEVWWKKNRDQPSFQGHLVLQGPPLSSRWPYLEGLEVDRSNRSAHPTLGHWGDWAKGQSWPGWRVLNHRALDPGDARPLDALGIVLGEGLPEPQSSPPRMTWLRPPGLVHRSPEGELRALNFSYLGPTPSARDPFWGDQLLRHGLLSWVHPVPDLVGPQQGGSRWDAQGRLVFRYPLLLQEPEGGRTHPRVRFSLAFSGIGKAHDELQNARRAWFGLACLAFALASMGAFLVRSPLQRSLGWKDHLRLGLYLPLSLLAAWASLAQGWWVAKLTWPDLVAPWGATGLLEPPILNWWHTTEWSLELAKALLLSILILWCAHRSRVAHEQLRWALGAEFSASALAAGVAHELRTPVAALRVDLELLALDQAPPEELPPLKQRLLRSLLRLEHRLEEVMAFARLSDGHRAATEPYHPKELALAAIAEAEPLLFSSGSSISLAGDAPEGPWYGDPAALRRALVELITNATKHAPGPMSLELSPKGWALRDHGPGIPKGLGQRAFEPFVRGPAKAQGAGLGLALVRATALAHHGQAWAEAAEGGGTRLHLQVRARG